MRRIICLCVAFAAVFATVFLAAESQAQEVVVNVSTRKIALALAQPQAQGGVQASLEQDVAKTMRHGLELSGLFSIIHPDQFLPKLANETTTSTSYVGWHATGADALIKVGYRALGSGLELDMRLYDVTGEREIKLAYVKPAATTSNYKPAVYAFVNAVIKHYTGQEGFLGQRILAVQRSKRGAPPRVVSLGIDGSDVSVVKAENTVQVLPSWGPGGGVLYTSYARSNPDLYLNGKLISSFSGMNTGADYCAGNGRIALTLSKDGNAEIYTMDARGGNLMRLTSNGAIDTSPSWSPDCSKIAFVSDRGGSPQIYVMNADGSGATRLSMVGKYNTNPAWARQGGKIAFSARDEYNGLDIFVMNSDGSELERITQGQGKNDAPSWSPDGRYLVFSSTRDGGSKIYLSTADGKSQIAVTEGSGYEAPVWSH
ncbi:MAG: hypothetical protein ACOX8U_04810 [Bradymonadia bacterium]|jgi:TolB protein